jgi:hypothetical protein
MLSDIVENTIANIRQRQTRTGAEQEAYETDEDEPTKLAPEQLLEKSRPPVPEQKPQKPIEPSVIQSINPKNLPLGHDGKPVPYWFYKQNGLHIEYKCEICGNYSYFGRKAWEKHFGEMRHAYGMKCLRIPNTAHFKEISKISEAVELYRKLLADSKKESI